METEQIQRDATPMAKLRRTGKGNNAASTAVQNGDAFAAIFELMAQSLQQGNNFLSPTTGDSSALVGSVQQAVAGTQKAGSSLMEQLTGTMLAQNPQLAAFLQANDTQAQQMLAGLKLPADVQQMLLSLRQTMTAALQQQTAAPTATAQTSAQTVQTVAEGTATAEEPAAQSTKGTGNNANPVQTTGTALKAGTAEEQTSNTALQAVNQFVQNVREAKKLMNGTQQKSRQTSTDEKVDVDALQNHAQASRPAVNAATLKSIGEMQTQTTDLTSQIKKGVAESLLNGKQEFVIKLKPDGLGEITVKLTEKAGEATTLHLLTANAETARLINSDLDSLKDAMRPLQVVVESAQSQQAGNGSEQTGQQQTSQQQFNAFAQHSGSHREYYGFQYTDADDTEPADVSAEVQNESALDSYI